MPRTLSAQVPEALAERVDRAANDEGRNRSQFMLAAIEFWAQLSPDAHLAISRVQAMGDEMRTRLLQRLEREMLDFQFTAVRERIADAMTVPETVQPPTQDALSDDDLLDHAAKLVAAGERR